MGQWWLDIQVHYLANWRYLNSKEIGRTSSLNSMAIYSGVDQKLIETILDEIHNGAAGLPDFQRSYVWDPDDTVNLIASISRHYPAGSILSVGNGNEYFVTRKFEEAPDNGHRPEYLILDGQQRLTSLYHAFFGCGEFQYFLDIDKFLNGDDIADGEVIKFEKSAKKTGGKPFRDVMESDFLYHAQNRVMPLSVIFGPTKNFHKWEKKVSKELLHDDREEF